VETEEWRRLPLPMDFEVRELREPLAEFADRFEVFLSEDYPTKLPSFDRLPLSNICDRSNWSQM
jgi:hypothetical protein